MPVARAQVLPMSSGLLLSGGTSFETGFNLPHHVGDVSSLGQGRFQFCWSGPGFESQRWGLEVCFVNTSKVLFSKAGSLKLRECREPCGAQRDCGGACLEVSKLV